jgi:hypothetical protein
MIKLSKLPGGCAIAYPPYPLNTVFTLRVNKRSASTRCVEQSQFALAGSRYE